MTYVLIKENEKFKFEHIEDMREKIEDIFNEKIQTISKEEDYISLQEYEDEETGEIEINFHSDTQLSQQVDIIINNCLKGTGEKTETKQILKFLKLQIMKEFTIAVKEVSENGNYNSRR